MNKIKFLVIAIVLTLYGSSLLFIYAIGHCALIFIAGLSVGFTESIIGSKGIRNISPDFDHLFP